MPRRVYCCPRCGLESSKKFNYTKHINKFKLCKVKLDDVIPAMDNVIVKMVPTESKSKSGIGNTYINDNSVTNNDNSVTNNDHSVNITINHIHYQFGSEDMSSIGPDFLKHIVNHGDKDEEYYSKNVQGLVHNIHFNDSRPYNMTCYTDMSNRDIYNTEIYNGKSWIKYQKATSVARTMQKNIAAKLIEVSRNLDDCSNIDSDKLDDFLNYLSTVEDDEDLVHDITENEMKQFSWLVKCFHPEAGETKT